jgi:phosphoribosyl 1,2-cyclic phosphodiesterase
MKKIIVIVFLTMVCFVPNSLAYDQDDLRNFQNEFESTYDHTDRTIRLYKAGCLSDTDAGMLVDNLTEYEELMGKWREKIKNEEYVKPISKRTHALGQQIEETLTRLEKACK